MSECKCSLAIKVLGEGCEVCNPAQALEYAKETIADQAQEIAELKRAIEAMRVAGGSVEFQTAFDKAKALIVTANAKFTGPSVSEGPVD